jgi:putative tricarboxylic transport membrane protein
MAIMGLSVVTTLGAKNMIKALIAALLGLFLATVGIDPMAGVPRFTFGLPALMNGIDFIPVLIGLFAISEILRQVMTDTSIKIKLGKIRTTLPSLLMQKRLMPTILGGSVLGTIVGILPGIGATTAAMVSYSEAVRWSKTPEKFGTGHPEGIAAPESSNNAAANGAMVPLLALGIPGSATTAVMLGAFVLHGLKPGPLLFSEQPEFISTIFLGTMIANALILIIAPLFIKGFANIIRVPYPVLGPAILVLCIIGSYAIRNNMMDVWLTLGFGVLGYVLEKYGFPLSPIILGIVLGGLAEQEFRRSLIMSQGSYAIFIDSPIAAVLIAVSILSFFAPIIVNFYKKRKANAAAGN